MTPTRLTLTGATVAALLLLLGPASGRADSTSPRLAAYYDLKMLVCGETAYRWRGRDRPRALAKGVIQVGVGRDAAYALTTSGKLLAWDEAPDRAREILDGVAWFAAGRTGVFAARPDGTLVYLARPESWFKEGELVRPVTVGRSAVAASIGDSANYFITGDGTVFVRGLAHRGQYGDGKLKSSEEFVPVASDAVAVRAHTGHAILLKRDGTVMGTGGNIYGPLGRHGIGDKAVSWGPIFRDAVAIATGSSHSLAVRRDGSLWHWGRDIGLDPEMILDDVVAAAADRSGSVALRNDDSLWQWRRGQKPELHFRCP